jgi:predicted ribosomally synthesized peptide with SipW-like signal peptide
VTPRRLPSLRLVLVLLLAAGALGGVVGGTVAAFTATTSNPGNSFSANATFPPEFVRHVGSSSCAGASSAVTVPTGGIPAGRTLVVQLVLRGTNYANAVAISDTRGNAWQTDRDVSRAADSVRTVVFSSYVATTLQAGDTITVTHGNATAEGIAVDELRRVPQASPTDATNGANGASATPTVAVTTTAGDRMVYGAFGTAGNQSVTLEDANFTQAHDVLHNCGGGAARARNHAAYRLVTTAASYSYAPTISGSVGWVAAGVAYKG